MPILDKIFQRNEARAEKYDPIHPKDPGLSSLFKGLFSKTSSGVTITPQNAMESISAVYAAISIISETIAIFPWELWEIGNTGKRKAINDPRYQLLNLRPNRFQNTIEYREMVLISYLTRGRAIIEKVYNNRGIITDLIPLHPDETKVFKVPTGELAYAHEAPGKPRRILLASEVIDIRGASVDGINCISPIEANAETLGIAAASEMYAGKYFGNGAIVSGVLETDAALSDQAYKRLQEWTERHQGVGRSHNPAILEEGLSWKPVTVNPETAQLLQTRSYSVEEVARIYRIPAYKLQRMDSVKFNTTEQQAIDFVTDTLLPRINKLQLTHHLALFSDSEFYSYKNEIVLKELLRGDSKARVDYYRGMWGMGALNSDTIRDEEGYNPIEDGTGTRYYLPVNVMPSDKIDEMLEAKTRPQPIVPGDQGNDTEQPRALFEPVVRSIFQRIINAERNAESRGKNMVSFFEHHKDFIHTVTEPLVESFGEEVRDFFNNYYLEQLQLFDARGAVNSEESRVNYDTENFLEFVLCGNLKKG